MDRVEEPTASSPGGEAKARTPAYASFESNTRNLSHLLRFILRGVQGFREELETKLEPEFTSIATEIAQVGRPQGKEASDQEARNSEEMINDLVQKLSDTLLRPVKQFMGGFLTVREWIPVLLVTTVEAYLKDVFIYAAKVDPAIMESSRRIVTYEEVIRARSLEELKERLPARWARNFLDDGGPDIWIKRLTNMGALGYRPETTNEMETLWGVRHLIVHSRGVATAEFVRRHPEFGVKVDESILIRSAQLTPWITIVYHFVDVTDFYFVQRYRPGTVSTP
jgi:hypothetical protein